MYHLLDRFIGIDFGVINGPIPSVVFLLQAETSTAAFGMNDMTYLVKCHEVGNHALDGFDVDPSFRLTSSTTTTDTLLNGNAMLCAQRGYVCY